MPDDKEDDLYDRVSDMADRLGLEDEERSNYIHEHMTRGGYRAVPNYVREEQDDKDGNRSRGSSFFSSGGSRDRGERRPRGRDDRGSRNRGSDNWYE